MLDEQAVLAVDDEPANQRAVRRALIDDCRVLTAGSGDEALATLASEPVALVIADQRMPGMSGATFLAATIERYPAVIRVVLTGCTDLETAIEVINRGHVYHFLSKPWDARELRQVVRRGLERFAAARERAHLHEALAAACSRAQRAAEQQSRLLALAAHELGTPLHILLNALALLRDGGLPAAAAPWAQMAERAADWLVRGVAQMQGAARIGARRLPLHPRPVELGALVAAAVAAVRAAAGERRLALAADAGPPLTVVCDPHWLSQALAALLSNAVRATPDGGSVRAGAAADGPWVVLRVVDSGVGIAPEHRAELFEPFSGVGGDLLLHGSGRFSFGARGLGLGLAMVQGIAAAHGGTVEVDSAPGQGSTFRLRLPRAGATDCG